MLQFPFSNNSVMMKIMNLLSVTPTPLWPHRRSRSQPFVAHVTHHHLLRHDETDSPNSKTIANCACD